MICEKTMRKEGKIYKYFLITLKDKPWVFPKETLSKKPKRNIHGKKVLLSVFWDQKGVIFFELLDPRETINAEKYCEQLKILKNKIHLEKPSLRKN